MLQKLAKSLNKEEVEKSSQAISNAKTQAWEDITNTKQVMYQQEKQNATTYMRTYHNKAKHCRQSCCITKQSQPKPTIYLPIGEGTRLIHYPPTHRALTQECAMTALHFSKNACTKAKQTHKEIARAIVDSETGKPLEYCPLKEYPKYQGTWKRSYGNKIRWLAQGMPSRVK